MSRIPLRVYNQEIEDAIEQQQFEGAIAHCHHILKTYPKHIDTYRLLGKAYLESRRYNNASDIFQRVLTSIPTDFISHIGMSIIREDEGDLNAAIWHMERAFESQPYNTAIQAELRRLYGLRDGSEPPKIRMTRGALARMYAKGDLYEQAIAEIRATLSSDPERPDLQVLLAEMYAKNGQESDAIQTCGLILQKLPYCLDANLLLTKLIPEEAGSDEIRTCHQRIQELDPYSAYISPQSPMIRDVPDQAVTISRLDWDGEPVVKETSDQPHWAKEIGVDLNEIDIKQEDLPEWLLDSETEDLGVGVAEIKEEEFREIPDWLQDAGWSPSDGTKIDGTIQYLKDLDDSEIEEAVIGDVPNWLLSIAPKDKPEEILEGFPEIDADEFDDAVPEWLNGKEEVSFDSEEDRLQIQDKLGEDFQRQEKMEDESTRERALPDEDLPEWLRELGEETSIEGRSEEPSPLPDWLERQPTEQTADEKQIPDWLELLEIETVDEQTIEPSSEGVEKIPEGLQESKIRDIVEEIKTEEIRDIHPEDEVPTGEEIPDWLKELGTEEIEFETEGKPIVEVEPETSFEQEYPVEPLEGEFGAEEKGAPKIDIPSEEEELKSTGIPVSLPELPSQEMKKFIEPVQPPEESVEPDAEIPDWLKEMQEEDEIETQIEQGPVLEDYSDFDLEPVVDAPDWLQEISLRGETEDEIISQQVQDILSEETEATETGIPDWLEEFQDKEGLKTIAEPELEPEIPSAEEELTPAEIPDWLQEIETEKGTEVGVEPGFGEEPSAEREGIIEAEIPDWLEEFKTEATLEGVDEIEPDQELLSEEELIPAEIPDWLQEIETEKITEAGIELEQSEEPPAEYEGEVEATIPDWLQEYQAQDEIEGEIELDTVQDGFLEEDAVTASKIPDWLQELKKDGEIESEVQSEHLEEAIFKEEGAVRADIPDWLMDLESERTQEETESKQEIKAEKETIDEGAEGSEWFDPSTEEVSQATFPTGVTGWLEYFDQEKVAKAKINYDTGELPQWLEDLDDAETEPEIESMVAESASPESFDETEGPESSDKEDAMEWLESLSERSSISEDELVSGSSDEPPISPLEDFQIKEIEEAEPIKDTVELDEVFSQESDILDIEDLEKILGEKASKEDEDIIVDSDAAFSWLDSLSEIETESDQDYSETLADTQPTAALQTEAASQTETEEVADSIDVIDDAETGDVEAAMAWLDDLASKSGITEEELMTQPEDALKEPLDTGQEELIPIQAVEEQEEPTTPELPLEESPKQLEVDTPGSEADYLESTLESEEEPKPEVQADIDQWEFDEVVDELAIAPDQLLTDAEEPSDEIGFPEDIDQEVTAEELESELDLEQPDSVEEMIVKDEIEAEISEEEIEFEETKALESEEPEFALEEEEIQPPSWVLEETAPPDEDYRWLPADLGQTGITKDLLDLNEASLIQLERLSSLGFRAAQAIVVYRQENGPFNSLDDLFEVPGLDEITINALMSEVKISTPVTDFQSRAEKLESETFIEEDKGELAGIVELSERAKISEDEFSEAILEYASLIEKGEQLDKVIEEMNKALYEDFSNELYVEIFQILGDAYAKADKLQEALDAYSKAEELLR